MDQRNKAVQRARSLTPVCLRPHLFSLCCLFSRSFVRLNKQTKQLYKINLALLLPYFGILALMIIFRVSELDENGQCHIGLLKPASLPLILYDIFLSCWLTALFIHPLMSSTSLLQGPSKGKLRDVARRTLMGCVIALILSSANVFTLVYFKGHERGLICLVSLYHRFTLPLLAREPHLLLTHSLTNVIVPTTPPTPGELYCRCDLERHDDPLGHKPWWCW